MISNNKFATLNFDMMSNVFFEQLQVCIGLIPYHFTGLLRIQIEPSTNHLEWIYDFYISTFYPNVVFKVNRFAAKHLV